jgi:NitT/TauT family transport system substrate-binding protein
MSDGQIAFGIKRMKELKVVSGGDAATKGIGTMSDERWKKSAEFMIGAGLLKPDTDWKRAYTLQFVKDLRVLP